MRTAWVLLLLVPASSAQVLFTDPAGDGLGVPGVRDGIDLLRAELVWGESVRPELHLEYTGDDGIIDVTWDAEDLFGERVGRYGVRIDPAAERFTMIRVGTVVEERVAVSGRIEAGNPATAIVEGLPLEFDFAGRALHDVQGRVSLLAGDGDTAEGVDDLVLVTAVRVDTVTPLGEPVDGSWLRVLVNGGPPVADVDEVRVLMGDGDLVWTAQLPAFTADDFHTCGAWSGHVYAQDARPEVDPGHPDYWRDLVQVNWGVEGRGDVITPSRLSVHTDPRYEAAVPDVEVRIDPRGWVQVALEPGWWSDESVDEDTRIRFELACSEPEAYSEFDRDLDGGVFDIPAPAAGLAILAAALLRRR